jgi:hypothetical protein
MSDEQRVANTTQGMTHAGAHLPRHRGNRTRASVTPAHVAAEAHGLLMSTQKPWMQLVSSLHQSTLSMRELDAVTRAHTSRRAVSTTVRGMPGLMLHPPRCVGRQVSCLDAPLTPDDCRDQLQLRCMAPAGALLPHPLRNARTVP